MRRAFSNTRIGRRTTWAGMVVLVVLAGLWLPGTAFAREKSDTNPYVVQLSASQITAVTSGYTWTIENQRRGSISQTYYLPDGVRYTRANGRISQLGWSVQDQGTRCVHTDDEFRCGLIANINGDLTICMTITPMGDCNYRVLTRREGDVFQLEALYKQQSQQP